MDRAASQPAQAAPSERATTSREPRPAAATQLERVEIIGGACNADTESRRQSTAAKIVIGREEIDRHGDANVADVLKRLPGVTLGGRPGRGGDIRMRGLGARLHADPDQRRAHATGHAQLDTLSPEQIRAHRGDAIYPPRKPAPVRLPATINIVLREDVKRRLNNVQITASQENGHIDPTASWTRADTLGAFSYNLSGTVNHRRSDDDATSVTLSEGLAPGRIDAHNTSQDERTGVHLGGRLQWRLGPGETLALMPFAYLSKGHNQAQADRLAVTGAQDPTDYTHYDARSRSMLRDAALERPVAKAPGRWAIASNSRPAAAGRATATAANA